MLAGRVVVGSSAVLVRGGGEEGEGEWWTFEDVQRELRVGEGHHGAQTRLAEKVERFGKGDLSNDIRLTSIWQLASMLNREVLHSTSFITTLDFSTVATPAVVL